LIKLGTKDARKSKPFSDVHWSINKVEGSQESILNEDITLKTWKNIEPNGRPISRDAAIVTIELGKRPDLPLLRR
jgi:hypothetical protein